MIHVVTKDASCYDIRDFSTVAVDADGLDATLGRVSTLLFDDYNLENFMRSKRFFAFRDWGLDGKRRIKLDDQWERYRGGSLFKIEGWVPGQQAPTESWTVGFDTWFKERILTEGWEDSETRMQWDKVRCDPDVMRQCIQPQTFKVPQLDQKMRRAWVEKYGSEGPDCTWSDSDSSQDL